MDADVSEQPLIARAQRGDRAAIEQLLERHQPRLWRFGLKLCRNEEDARDLLQETMLAAARSIGGFRGEASLSTWLFTIARSYCIKHRRHRVHAPARLESLETDSGEEVMSRAAPDADPEAAAASAELGVALDQAISALAVPYREVLLLRDVEGLSAPEAASVLGVSVDAIKSRLHRARAAVKERLAPAFGPEAAPATAGCPDIVNLFSRHLEDDIDKQLCLQMEEHLKTCPHCRSKCDGLRQTLALCKTSPLPTVPPQVQESIRAALRALAVNPLPPIRL